MSAEPGARLGAMRTLIALIAGFLLIGSAQAQRHYSQAELDAMLAPIALQTDGVVSQVLIASTYPEEVGIAAQWTRANPHLRGEDATRAAQGEPWDPSVKALVAFPELVQRMADSPQWLQDLGEAFAIQQAQVMDTVQALRRRAQANGNLPSTDQTSVYQDNGVIVVQPRTQIVYVPYYDPYVVYGSWWWPHYRPVFWNPWVVRPVFFASGHVHHFHGRPDWHRHYVPRPAPVRPRQPPSWHRAGPAGKASAAAGPTVRPHVRVPESQRRPIVSSAPQAQPQRSMPTPRAFSAERRQPRQMHPQRRAEPRSQNGRRG
jgi:hypothetical protein